MDIVVVPLLVSRIRVEMGENGNYQPLYAIICCLLWQW